MHNRQDQLAAALLLFAALLSGACSRQPAVAAQKPAVPSHDEMVARGKYLVTVFGCNDCHTPMKMGPQGPEPDMSRMLSGHPETLKMGPPPKLSMEGWAWAGTATNTAFVGPWGITYTANLTPDQNTGMGIWTEDMFTKAMRAGRHMGDGRPLQPPMPWQWIAQMTDDDLKAVFAYLGSIPPISNHVPDYQEPPPAKN